MHLPTPDPGFTTSPRARANFRLAATLSVAFVALVWLLQLANWTLGLDAAPFGVRPRTIEGLAGILFAPLSHSGFEHLVANTIPLAVLGTAMLHLYPRAAPVVLPWVYLAPGIAVWLFGRDAIHVGASGLIYGLTAYVFFAGLLRRDRRAIAASLVVAFLYGGAIWGVGMSFAILAGDKAGFTPELYDQFGVPRNLIPMMLIPGVAPDINPNTAGVGVGGGSNWTGLTSGLFNSKTEGQLNHSATGSMTNRLPKPSRSAPSACGSSRASGCASWPARAASSTTASRARWPRARSAT